MKTKLQTMAEFLECDLNEVNNHGWDDNVFSMEGEADEYMILTDDEADQIAREYILDSVWAFNPSFLASHSSVDEEIFEMLRDKYELANDVIKNSIDDIDYFVEDAISTDGRGHFINTYDFSEEELNNFFIYRVN